LNEKGESQAPLRKGLRKERERKGPETCNKVWGVSPTPRWRDWIRPPFKGERWVPIALGKVLTPMKQMRKKKEAKRGRIGKPKCPGKKRVDNT